MLVKLTAPVPPTNLGIDSWEADAKALSLSRKSLRRGLTAPIVAFGRLGTPDGSAKC